MYWYVELQFDLAKNRYVELTNSCFTLEPKDLSKFDGKDIEFGFNIPIEDSRGNARGYTEALRIAIDMSSNIMEQRLDALLNKKFEEEQDARHLLTKYSVN